MCTNHNDQQKDDTYILQNAIDPPHFLKCQLKYTKCHGDGAYDIYLHQKECVDIYCIWFFLLRKCEYPGSQRHENFNYFNKIYCYKTPTEPQP